MSENNWERDVLEKLMLQTLKEQRVVAAGVSSSN